MAFTLVRKKKVGSSLTPVGSDVGTRNALTNNVVVPYPADSQAGDLIIVSVLAYRNSTSAYTITTPSGWTLLGEHNAVATGGTRLALFSRQRGTETSVTISASVTLFWVAPSYAFRGFYAADPIEHVGNLQFFVGESSNWATTPILLGAPSGVLHLGGGALNATTATSETWGRGTKLGDYSVNPSSPAIRLTATGAFENVPSAGVVSSNPLVHNNRRVNQWAATVAIRPASYVQPAPSLVSVSPTSGGSNGGAVVYVGGTGFLGTGNTTDTVVKIDGVSVPTANVTVLSSRLLVVTMPSGTVGKKDITVQTSAGTSNALPFTYALVTLTAQGMTKSGSQTLTNGSFQGATNKLTGFVAASGTSAENVVSDALKVNGSGNITVSATASYNVTSSVRLDIWRNGARVSTTTATTSASWTGDVADGDLLELHVWKTTTLGRSVSSASLDYTVNSGGGTVTPAEPTLFFSHDFAGTGPLDPALFFTSGGGVHDRVNGELNGDNTPSIPISFTWLRQPVPTQDVILRTRLRWNGRNPLHSAVGLAIRGNPYDDYGNPGIQNGVMFVCTANIMSLYYEDYDQTNGFVSLTGQQYVSISKYPENALLELHVRGNTFTAYMNGVQQLTGTTTAIDAGNRYVGLTSQNDILESGGGEAPARLDDFEVFTL